MDFDTDTIEPQIGETPPQTPPDTTANAKLRLLHTAIGKEYNLGSFDEFKQKIQDPDKRKKLYDAVGKEYNLGNYDDFQTKLGFGNKGQTTPIAPQAAPPQEHEIVHNPLQDIRHVQEMANQPVPTHVIDPQGGLTEEDPEAAKQNKAYKSQYDKLSADLGSQWGTKPEAVKQVLQDFPNEQDENKLKSHAALATENPVAYGRLKSADDIRVRIVQDGPNGVHDANVFNHLLDAQNYQQLTEEHIPYQMQVMREHNLGQGDMDKLKEAQRSLINSTDVGLLQKYWNSKDKEYGLTPDEYAGLETERLFNPNKATMDEGILKHSRGIGEDGKANPLDMSKESYAYQRGVENIKYNLQNTGRENLAQFISEHKGENDKQIAALTDEYQKRINSATSTQEQQQLIEEFKNHPVVQEANKLEDAQQGLQYSESEDQRRYPLNFSDQATRAVADAMDHTQGFGTNAVKLGETVLQGAGETSDNTMRFIKNTAINLLGSDESRAFNNAVNIGHQSLTELAAYEPTSYTGRESPLIVPREIMQSVQSVFNGSGSDAEKEQKAISYIRDNLDQLKVNPKSGQQNLTGKATLFQAANVMGQILGVANESFLLGGAIGDASKLQQMATAFTPMYMSTQNQMYEQALKNGDEHPLLKSNIDATIISLASLINPDIKVVKGMLGAETGVGKMLAGISEDTWNKVLTTNKPWLDKTIAVAKATGRQLGLANLQYGVIAPTAQYLAHKTVLNEDANLGDMIKDSVIQTSLYMALPALLHGVWAGKRATEVNPAQKYAIVEAGLHSEQQIDLVQSQIEKGIIPEIQGHEMKQIIKHAGEILQNSEMIKTDGTPMNEREVADTVYNMLRKEVLEKKMKTAAEPVKPIIEDKIHEINKDITDLHTSADDQHKNELNQLLHDNLDRIKDKAPEFEQTVKDAIAANNPEEAFKIISDKANETKKVEGVETSLRPEAEEIYGKPLVEKAIELSKQKPKNNGKTNETEAGDEKALLGQQKLEGVETSAGTAPSISKDAEELLNSISNGSKPAFVTKNLERIAKENGIEVTNNTTPDDIINLLKEKQNAIQEPSAGGIFQHPQEGIGSEGGERGGMERGQQGEGTSEESSGPQAEQSGGEIPPKEVDPNALPFGRSGVGIAERIQKIREYDTGVKTPESGEGISAQQGVEKGRELLSQGADPDKIIEEFQKDNKISAETIGVVRARLEQLSKETNDAIDAHGEDSPEAKAAIQAESEFAAKIQPMQTEWHKIGMTQQGEADLDTGTIASIKRAFRDVSGKPLTEKQSETAKELHGKLKEQDKKIEKLQTALDELINKQKTSEKGVKEKASEIAKKIRENAKLNRPGMFSAATPASLVWDSAVEIVAKSIEAGGTIAEAIGKGIDHIKESEWYKGLSADLKKKAEKEFSDWHKDETSGKIDIKTHFVDKKDNSFTPNESKAIWEHAKEVIKDGKTDLHDVIKQVAMDTGLSSEQVRRAISSPKGAKVVTDKMYAEMYKRNQILTHAKAWVKSADQSGPKKFWNKVLKVPAAIVTFGHGSVAPITHVGADLYRPSNWKSYFSFMLDSYTFSFGGVSDAGKARYEKAMGDLVHDPMYPMAKRAGLKIDPTDLSGDDYSKYQGVFGRLSKMGERGFNAMKPYRLEQFKKIYNGLTTQAQANGDILKEVARMVNISSGTTDAKLASVPGLDIVAFAPKLVVSQYQRIITEPVKAVATFVGWKNATDAQKLQAKMVARHAGEMTATYLSLLAANQAILSMNGSKQKINFTNPLGSDWMKFKVLDKTVEASGGVNSALRLVGSLVEEGLRANGVIKTSEKSKPGDTDQRLIARQAVNKLSPAGADVKEILTGTDMMGNPLPWSAVAPSKGHERLTWNDYLTTKLPIPLAEGMKTFSEAAKDNGMRSATLNNYLEGIVIGVLTGTTGAKISPDYSLKKGGDTGGGGSGGYYGK